MSCRLTLFRMAFSCSLMLPALWDRLPPGFLGDPWDRLPLGSPADRSVRLCLLGCRLSFQPCRRSRSRSSICRISSLVTSHIFIYIIICGRRRRGCQSSRCAFVRHASFMSHSDCAAGSSSSSSPSCDMYLPCQFSLSFHTKKLPSLPCASQ